MAKELQAVKYVECSALTKVSNYKYNMCTNTSLLLLKLFQENIKDVFQEAIIIALSDYTVATPPPKAKIRNENTSSFTTSSNTNYNTNSNSPNRNNADDDCCWCCPCNSENCTIL